MTESAPLSNRKMAKSIWLSQYDKSKWMCLICDTHHPVDHIVCLTCNKSYSPDFDSSTSWVCPNIFCARSNCSYRWSCYKCGFKKKTFTFTM